MSVDLIRTSVEEVAIHESLARARLSRPSTKFVARAEPIIYFLFVING